MKISEIPLFHGISSLELNEMKTLGCIRQHTLEKNTTIFHMGETISEMGIVLSGSVIIENIDLWGKRSILSHIPEGHVFAETYAMCGEPLMVSAVTAEDSEILFFNLKLLLNSPGASSPFPKAFNQNSPEASHGQNAGQPTIVRNLLRISMQKNLTLSNRIFCTTPKTIRERLLIYLSNQSIKAASTSFTIPFNRQGLADYLNLDRSALSKELGKMRDDGILEFHKNHFILHKTDE